MKNPKSESIRAMHIINGIAITVFILGILYKIFIDK
ncbi:DUF6728 family protein [Sphingobacterium rhinopitheci]|nr:DUF6728 family protein [Sphingobacterium rhinopitheci]